MENCLSQALNACVHHESVPNDFDQHLCSTHSRDCFPNTTKHESVRQCMESVSTELIMSLYRISWSWVCIKWLCIEISFSLCSTYWTIHEQLSLLLPYLSQMQKFCVWRGKNQIVVWNDYLLAEHRYLQTLLMRIFCVFFWNRLNMLKFFLSVFLDVVCWNLYSCT